LSEEKQAERVIKLGFPPRQNGKGRTREALGEKEGKERSKVESRPEVDNVGVVVAAVIKVRGIPAVVDARGQRRKERRGRGRSRREITL